MKFTDFQKQALKTDQTAQKDLTIPTLGLVGELGGIFSLMKKRFRDRDAFLLFDQRLETEIGDVLWYLSNLCSKLGIRLLDVANQNLIDSETVPQRVNCTTFAQYQKYVGKAFNDTHKKKRLITVLDGLIRHATDIFSAYKNDKLVSTYRKALQDILWYAAAACEVGQISLDEAAKNNLNKIKGCYIEGKTPSLFDKGYPAYETIPRKLEIKFHEISVSKNQKKVKLFLNDVIIGDSLTDNAHKEDCYRFHDIFHLAYLAILGWSPVMRALLKRKRKSKPAIDENEDGARAGIIEEAIVAYVFNYAKEHDYFKNISRLDVGLIETIKSLTNGLEVEECSQMQWQKAILEGYKIFAQLKENNGGIVYLDLNKRTITYKKPRKRR